MEPTQTAREELRDLAFGDALSQPTDFSITDDAQLDHAVNRRYYLKKLFRGIPANSYGESNDNDERRSIEICRTP